MSAFLLTHAKTNNFKFYYLNVSNFVSQVDLLNRLLASLQQIFFLTHMQIQFCTLSVVQHSPTSSSYNSVSYFYVAVFTASVRRLFSEERGIIHSPHHWSPIISSCERLSRCFNRECVAFRMLIGPRRCGQGGEKRINSAIASAPFSQERHAEK